jgi:hypothetical protein
MKVDYNIGLTIFWAILLLINTIGILNGFKGDDKNE